MSLDIFTDGACLGNPGPGGWGVVIVDGGGTCQEFSGHAEQTTNNRMELKAVIEALRLTQSGRVVTLHTDSQYVKNGITLWIKAWQRNGWWTSQRKPVKNQDLWQELSGLVDGRSIEWIWVKGHSGHPGNEAADALATGAARALLDKRTF